MTAHWADAKTGVRGFCLRAALVSGMLLFLGASLVLPRSSDDPGKDKSFAKPGGEPKGPPVLEKKLKPDRIVPGVCKLTGDVKDNWGVFEAEFRFTTRHADSIVAIGLKEGNLFDPEGLDQRSLAEKDMALRGDDDGFVLEVARPGTYRVALHLMVRVRRGDSEADRKGEPWENAAQAALQAQRQLGFKLGLPGALVTVLSLGMPSDIKEIRCQNNLEKTREEARPLPILAASALGQLGSRLGAAPLQAAALLLAGRSEPRWEIVLGATRMLEVTWKEPVVLPGTGPLLVVKNNINVKLEDPSLIVADLQLEDLRGLTREWQLFVPARAEVKVPPLPGLAPQLLPPAKNQQFYTIKFKEPTSERFHVRVEVRTPRNTLPLPVGPFFVQALSPDAKPTYVYSQQGTITVQASPAAVRGQYLSFHPVDGVHPRDIPKEKGMADVKAVFEYSNPEPPKGKGVFDPKLPLLEIRWRMDRGSVETAVDHLLTMSLRPGNKGLLIDLETKIKVRSLSVGDYLDVQLPLPPLPTWSLSLLPAASFPAGVPWGAFAEHPPRDVVLAAPVVPFTLDASGSPATMSQVDDHGKARIHFSSSNKEFTLILSGQYVVPAVAAEVQRFRIELPKPFGIVDRGGTVSVQGVKNQNEKSQIELLMGPPKDEFSTSWDPSSTHLDLSWRPYHPQMLVQNDADVVIRGKEAQLRQQFTCKWSPKPGGGEVPRTGLVSLVVPANARGFKVISGGERVSKLKDPGPIWVKLAGKVPPVPLIVEFDQPLPEGPDIEWKVPLLKPVAQDTVTAMEVKVRVWCDPGVQPEALDVGDRWQIRGTEVVQDKPALPVLVLLGSGQPLTLRLPNAAASQLPVMMCDKGLIQASVDEDGTHRYRASYLIQRLYVNPLKVRFPAPADACMPKVTLNGVGGDRRAEPLQINWQRDGDDRNVALLDVDPKILRSLVRRRRAGQGARRWADADADHRIQAAGQLRRE